MIESIDKRELVMAGAIGLLTDRHRYSNELSLLQSWACFGDEVAQKNADYHSEKNPDGEESISGTRVP